MLLFLTGCTAPGANSPGAADAAAEVPFYTRSTSQTVLKRDYNPYWMEFTENGVFYFVLGSEMAEPEEQGAEPPAEDEAEYINVYRFYFQPYGESEAVPVCEIKNGFVRDFSGFVRDGREHLAILWLGEEAHITECEETGENSSDMVIDGLFNDIGKFPILLAMSNGEFAVCVEEKVYLLNADGGIEKTVALEGAGTELLAAADGSVYATYEKEDDGASYCMAELDFAKGSTGKLRDLPGDSGSVFVLGGSGEEEASGEPCFVSCSQDYAFAFQMNGAGEERLIDLKKQSILSSQIKGVFGNRKEIKLVSMERSDASQGVILMTLTKADEEALNAMEDADKEIYTEDGRRIVRVAVPENYLYRIELHATKYNQISDTSFVEIERFSGMLEDYLGKGNKPDVIVLSDHTQIASFVEKDILANLVPLYEAQDKYSLEELIPEARRILGADEGENVYAMTGRFKLLIRPSDGTEYDSEGKCTTVEYLKWYEAFLNENEVSGMGNLENILYADVASFYDETTGEVFFTSDAFKELMRTYREVVNGHMGEAKFDYADEEDHVRKSRLVLGPYWHMAYSVSDLTVPGLRLSGIPISDGSSCVYMRLDGPLGILSASECKEAAFDFIMYYSELNEYCWDPETYGLGLCTEADFSVFERVLREEIYETQLPYYPSLARGDFYFTDEQKEQLAELIASSIPETKTQRDIFELLMQEMEGYFQGGKELDMACEILQNRASLYFAEQNP